MKKINETNLRKIIREELENVLDNKMSILPEGTTPELFAKAYNMFWGAHEGTKNAFNDERKRKFYAFELSHGGYSQSPLTEKEAEEWAMLASICMDNKENYQYNYRTIVPVIAKALKTKKESIYNLYGMGDIKNLYPNINEGNFQPHLNWIIYSIGYNPGSNFIRYELKSFKDKYTAEDLQKQVDFMTSVQAFTEPKELDRATLTKLKKMAFDISGLIQAAELYSML